MGDELTRSAAPERTERWTIVAIVLGAVAARLLAFSPFAIHHPDEQIQYLEQAHRLAFGPGVVPWEYRLGMRSWLVPVLLAGPMWLGDRLAPGTLLYVVLPRASAALAWAAVLWAAYRIGRRLSPAHGLVALAAMALWPESVYFSVHLLTETFAVAAFLPAAALLLGERRRGEVVSAGALLALAVVFRFHYAPAALVLALLTLRGDRRRWWWLILGALGPVLVSSAVDMAMGGWPFGWIVNNVRYNVVEGRAARFGLYGPFAYLGMLALAWLVGLVPIVWLALRGVRRLPVLGWVMAANLAVHMLIGHKEYRFILLTTQLAILLAAIGTVELVDEGTLTRWCGSRGRPLAAMMAGWTALAIGLAASLPDPGWRRDEGYPLIRLAHERRICGVALFADAGFPSIGQTYLHDATPVYYFNGDASAGERAEVAATAGAFDAVIAPPGRASIPAAYRPVACEDTLPGNRRCLAIRPGGCVRTLASEPHLVQRVMEANGF